MEYLTKGAAHGSAVHLLLLENAEHFFLTHHEKFLAIDLNFGARILSEQNAVSRFYIEREDFAFIIRLAFTYRDSLAFLRLFFGRVGNMMPPRIDSVSSTRRTRMRSWRGVKLVTEDGIAVAVAIAFSLRRGSSSSYWL